MRLTTCVRVSLLSLCLAHAGGLAHAQSSGPEAARRSYASNYKDLVLATCIATAYQQDAAADAGSSVSALRDFTYYDMEKSPDAISALVEKYLKRDYRNPLASAESKEDIKFSLLKCMDMYHSKELNDQVKRFVDKPNRTYRQDHPAKK